MKYQQRRAEPAQRRARNSDRLDPDARRTRVTDIYTPTRTLEEKLAWARDGVARWEGKMALADRKHEAAREMGGGIPGFGASGNQRAAGQVRSAGESAQRAWREATDKLNYFTEKARGYERRIAERDRVHLTRSDIVGARAIRTAVGWRIVVKVNTKTVSVRSGYSWNDLVPIEQILEVRA
jgi:hypothetical protein